MPKRGETKEKKSFWESEKKLSNFVIVLFALFIVVTILYLTFTNKLTPNQIDSLFELLKFVAGGIFGYIIGSRRINQNGR